MRSRFSAYSLGNIDHLQATTDPAGPHWRPDATVWRQELQAFCTRTRFLGLRILEAPPPQGAHGVVAFHATLERDGGDVSFGERSRFVRRGGRWLYVDGEQL